MQRDAGRTKYFAQFCHYQRSKCLGPGTKKYAQSLIISTSHCARRDQLNQSIPGEQHIHQKQGEQPGLGMRAPQLVEQNSTRGGASQIRGPNMPLEFLNALMLDHQRRLGRARVYQVSQSDQNVCRHGRPILQTDGLVSP
jgi:hypothetical protein